MRLNSLSRLRRNKKRIGYNPTPVTKEKQFACVLPWSRTGNKIRISITGLKNQDFELVLSRHEAKKLARYIDEI